MKKIFSVVLLALATLGLGSCKKSDDTAAVTGVWTRQAYFSGLARSGAVAFTINGKAYAGLGQNGIDTLGAFKDFYTFNPAVNSWTPVARFPGKGRYFATAFSDSQYGYVGTGYDGLNYLADFWRYDPAANKWTRIADFPAARYGAVAFTAKNTGYVGTGYNGSAQNDFYQYNATANTWTSIGYPGAKRQGASAFTINDIGYVMLGTANAAYPVDVYSYDPAANKWTQHRDLILHSASSTDGLDYDYHLVPRTNASTFTVGAMGYIALGSNGAVETDCWAYDPSVDTWTVKTAFTAATTSGGSGGAARTNGIGFGIGSLGYVGLGTNGTTRIDDLYQFDPNAVIQ
ncbi:Kelch repeat-containing protein [Hymenobacter caeli]|uniref:N-acetylneuraminic acid mutarotase n=1 Tax=Hymenobacter caeli TaxID=2735894 RepID=A0ABX2FTH7_9BACT|nr:kelch repeat-containing protein [Hymenobacter caeli]NRT20491.1 N-acetylneuraminic acid mutarotase [Hymenobacter caeli]